MDDWSTKSPISSISVHHPRRSRADSWLGRANVRRKVSITKTFVAPFLPTRLSNFPSGSPKKYFSHKQVISVGVLLSKPNLAIQINPHWKDLSTVLLYLLACLGYFKVNYLLLSQGEGSNPWVLSSVCITAKKTNEKNRNLSIFLNFCGIILLLRFQWSVLLHHAVVNSLCRRSHVVVVKSATKYLNESLLNVQTIWLLVGVHTQMKMCPFVQKRC